MFGSPALLQFPDLPIFLLAPQTTVFFIIVSLYRTECSSHDGGTLASIHKREENYFLSNLVRPHGQFGALTFIGATKVEGNNTVFEWDDGTEWDFENWEPGEGSRQINWWILS